MSIEADLDADLKAAMRAKDAPRVACIRSVRSKIQEAVTAKGFSGEKDDALFRKVITAYVKQLQKSFPELESAGERGKELRASYEGEIAYLDKYLPKLLGEAETRELVRQAIAQTGVTDAKRAGQVVGAVMKAHKESGVDAALAKRIAEELLGAG